MTITVTDDIFTTCITCGSKYNQLTIQTPDKQYCPRCENNPTYRRFIDPNDVMTEEEQEEIQIINANKSVTEKTKNRIILEEQKKLTRQADRMLQYASENIIRYFVDQNKNNYIQYLDHIDCRNVLGVIPLESEFFRKFIVRITRQEDKIAVAPNVTNTVIHSLSSDCVEEIPLFNRVGVFNNDIYIDMCNRYFESIRVDVNGWRICHVSPIMFRRYNHMKPLITPAPQTSLEEARENINLIFKYANISEEDRLIFLTLIINYLIPKVPHPILVLHGIQGSAKSSTFRTIQSLIDPSANNLLSLPSENSKEKLIIQLEKYYLAFYDNISYINQDYSNILCQAVTSFSEPKRKLWTDNEMVNVNIQCCLGLNGINQTAERSDLLSRAIIIETQPLERFIAQEQLEAMFQYDAPIILSSMLTILVEALRIRSTVETDGSKRMADFQFYGAAIAVALGYSVEEFNEKYQVKTVKQEDETIEKDIVAQAFLLFFNEEFSKLGCEEYEESYVKLLEDLKHVAQEQLKINVFDKSVWPQNTISFGRRFNVFKPALMKKGYSIEKVQKANSGWYIHVSFKPVSNSETPTQNTVKTTVTSEAIQQQLNHNNNSSKPNDELLYQIYNQQQRQTETPIEPPVLQTDPKHSIFSCREQEEINRLPQPKPSQNPLQSMSSPVYTPMTCGQCTHYHTTECTLPDPQRTRISQGAMHCYNCPKFTQKPLFLNNQPVPSQTIVEESFEELMNKEFDQI